jgi:sugar porter (SP) family MFS transporter
MITSVSHDSSTSLHAHFNSGYIWLISLCAAMGGLLFGYDWVVIGGAKPFFEPHFRVTDPAISGWVNSCALIGCFFGAMLTGTLGERVGRKYLLMISALIFVVTSLGNALADNLTLFIAWRMLGGLAIGLASNLSPMYIAEIAPPSMRGRLVSVNQLTIVVGVLLAQLINWLVVKDLPEGATAELIRGSWYGQSAWRWMFGITAIPSALFLIATCLVPESPRWLVGKGRNDEARKVLGKIGGSAYADEAMADILKSVGAEKDQKNVSLRELFAPSLRPALVLGIVLAVFQQWCGINVIFNYAEEIFRSAGYSLSNVLQNIAWTGSVNLVFTFVALGTVDRMGRRPLMVIGSIGLAVVYSVLGWCYFTHTTGLPVLLLVLAAIACYAMSLAPVTWVVISEIFPNRVRGKAMSVAIMALWAACFILTYTFPILNKSLGASGTFWVYAGICAAGAIFIWIKLPETKGKSLEQIENDWK